jgi:hypothetical protein
MAAEPQRPSHRRDRLLEIQKWAQAKWEAAKVNNCSALPQSRQNLTLLCRNSSLTPPLKAA